MGLYASQRRVDDVLQGSDAAAQLVDVCTVGDNTRLLEMLSDSEWIKIITASPHRIYSEGGTFDGVRQVLAMPLLNLEFLLQITARNRHVESTSALLDFALQQKLSRSAFITREVIVDAIRGGNAAVFATLADVRPKIINYNLAHGLTSLGEAIITSRTDIVAYLVTHGANLVVNEDCLNTSCGYGRSALSASSSSGNARTTELLLQNGAMLVKSGALHMAAQKGKLDVIDVLVKHGADVNELLPESYIESLAPDLYATWTPSHFAASEGEQQALLLLEQHGADVSLKDKDGNTAKQLLQKSES